MSNNWLLAMGYINPSPYFYNTAQYYIMWCIIYICIKKAFYHSLIVHLPPTKRLDGLTRICSSLQASILYSWSAIYLFDVIDYELWTHVITISASFGIFDLCIITLNYNKYKSKYIGILTHHTLLLFAPLMITETTSTLCAKTYLFEITVPFIDISWFLYNTGLNNTIFFKIIFTISVLIFFVFRVLNNCFLVYQTIYYQKLDIMIIGLIFLSLNVSWFYSLLKLFINSLK